ncbi:hypothetical protein AwEntero_27780 [Enterobacterales bacterium]|nr:hypothetical protein AwEntero_27780 [Enterobacterales bacterium]
MALWQCDLRVSWRSQLISLGIHGGIMLVILLAPWPAVARRLLAGMDVAAIGGDI